MMILVIIAEQVSKSVLFTDERTRSRAQTGPERAAQPPAGAWTIACPLSPTLVATVLPESLGEILDRLSGPGGGVYRTCLVTLVYLRGALTSTGINLSASLDGRGAMTKFACPCQKSRD